MSQTEARVSSDGRERRACMELRAIQNEQGNIVEGHAALFNTNTMLFTWLRESVTPGAFKNAILRSDPRLLINHNEDLIFARKSNNTLEVIEDELGLFYRAKMQGSHLAEHYYELIRSGTISESSFQFTILRASYYDVDDFIEHRNIDEVNIIYDVAPAVFPAYTETTSVARSKKNNQEEKEKLAAAARERRKTIISFFQR